jgi:hypothetical protein
MYVTVRFLYVQQGGLAPKYRVAPLETLSFTESFLGIAISLLRLGRLAMHDISPGSLCHATQSFSALLHMSSWLTMSLRKGLP